MAELGKEVCCRRCMYCRQIVGSHNRISRRLYRQNRLRYPPCPFMKTSFNGASIIFGYVLWVIWGVLGCKQSQTNNWPPLLAKQIAIPSLPHLENQSHLSINVFWTCSLGNMGCNRLQSVINELLAAFIGKRNSEKLPALS